MADTTPSPERGPDERQSPYSDLLVPLVVTPALIVMVLVLVYALFGALAGDESTPRENLDRMLHGGRNERQQAAFELTRQVTEDLLAEPEGREPVWDLDHTLLPELRRAWDETSPNDPAQRYVLAVMMAQLGGAEDVARLASLVDLPVEQDPERHYPFRVLRILGGLGPRLDDAGREVAARAAADALESDDPGLRTVAANSLRNLPSPWTEEVLRGALDDPSLQVRANAAISLSHLGDPAAAPVLRELVEVEGYEAERAADPTAWASDAAVRQSRRLAVEALGRLDRPEDEPFLREIAEEDPDLEVRDAALRSLRGSPARPGGTR